MNSPDAEHTWRLPLTGGPCPQCGSTTLTRCTEGPGDLRTVYHCGGTSCQMPLSAGHLQTLRGRWAFVSDAEFGPLGEQ